MTIDSLLDCLVKKEMFLHFLAERSLVSDGSSGGKITVHAGQGSNEDGSMDMSGSDCVLTAGEAFYGSGRCQ